MGMDSSNSLDDKVIYLTYLPKEYINSGKISYVLLTKRRLDTEVRSGILENLNYIQNNFKIICAYPNEESSIIYLYASNQ